MRKFIVFFVLIAICLLIVCAVLWGTILAELKEGAVTLFAQNPLATILLLLIIVGVVVIVLCMFWWLISVW